MTKNRTTDFVVNPNKRKLSVAFQCKLLVLTFALNLIVERIAEKPTNMNPHDPTRLRTFAAKEDPNAIKHD